MTGVQWQKFESDAETHLTGLTQNGRALSFDITVAQSLAARLKEDFMLGIMELGATLPADAVPFMLGVSPRQLVKGLDKFYEDYRNTNVKILEALDIVHREVKGEPPDWIDFWTRYYRADESDRDEIMKNIPPGIPFRMKK